MQKHPRWRRPLCAVGLSLSLPLSHGAAQITESPEAMPTMLDRRLDSAPLPSRAEDNVAPSHDEVSEPGDEQPPSDPNALPPVDLVVRLAIGSPVGALGADLSLNITRWLAVRVGAGGGAGGGQLSSLVALRTPWRRCAIGIASGFSVGGYETVDYEDIVIHVHGSPTHGPFYRWNRVAWWNTELFFEARVGHVVVRPFLGAGVPLTRRPPSRCEPGDLPCEPSPQRPPDALLLGLGVGWG